MQIALDIAVDYHNTRRDSAYDRAPAGDDNALRLMDRAFYPALQNEILLDADIAFEAQRRTEHRDVEVDSLRPRIFKRS